MVWCFATLDRDSRSHASIWSLHRHGTRPWTTMNHRTKHTMAQSNVQTFYCLATILMCNDARITLLLQHYPTCTSHTLQDRGSYTIHLRLADSCNMSPLPSTAQVGGTWPAHKGRWETRDHDRFRDLCGWNSALERRSWVVENVCSKHCT